MERARAARRLTGTAALEQLPLKVGPPDRAVFDAFLPGSNGALVHALTELAGVRRRALVWLWGPAETGRTHLLHATVSEASGRGFRAAYLPLAEGLSPAALDGMAAVDVLCLDDVDAVAGMAEWERALFRLFEGLRERSARLVLSAARAPLHTDFRLPDLASRFGSAATFRVRALDDEAKIEALKLRAGRRGFDLPDETARFLLQRVDRGTAALFDLLDRLDHAALAAQKRLTVPFVRDLLDRR